MLAKSMAVLARMGLTGCVSGTERAPARLTDRQSRELARELDGKTPGKPVTCVSRVLGRDGLHAVTDALLLYRVSRDLGPIAIQR